MNKKMPLYTLLLSLATLFMGIGYASVNNIAFDVSGNTSVKPNESIEITDVTYLSDNNADTINSKINNYTNTMLNSTIILKDDKESSITYQITLTNDTDYDYKYIDTIYDSKFYDNENIVYEVSGIAQNEIVASKTTKNITITFKYKEEDISKTTLNSYLNFKFKRLYSITYENITDNNYPKTVEEKGTLDITFTDAPENIEVEGDVTHTYNNGVLTLTNVKSNITIKIPLTAIYISKTTNLRLGDTINPENYTNGYQEKDVSTTYMKYIVDESYKITGIEICKKESTNAKAICLIGDDASKYSTNKSLILKYFGGDENIIPNECTEEENLGDTEFTCANSYVVLATDSGGGVHINNIENHSSCVINSKFGIYSCK